MMGVHEFGHVLHACCSGGSVSRVSIPAFGFSLTEIGHNPSPHFVAWGGPVWGSLLPLGMWGLARACKQRYWFVVRFFAGFCLVANGAYLGVGSIIRAGDAGDLMSYGSPQWLLVAFGVVTVPVGLYLWNGLGRHFGLGRPHGVVGERPPHPLLTGVLSFRGN